ncbi:hypothetical protein [Weissella confusa]|uniref:Primase C-terminal 1 domain-containing protein n=1 Tax=Weissella confusa TaxID=1583 RepID=A0A4Z0S5Y4_WEICO|nr:hypothetical protein [Weissella confusa]TGE74889.1 hypothetical protein C6P11_02565 [Weissella confusa]
MSYAFKVSGIYGDYDVVEELDVVEYTESLPQVHDPIDDLDDFKTRQAQYFTPSTLKNGLTRSRENIADIQGILFDLDNVPDRDELQHDFYTLLTKTKLEVYLWLTPSAIAIGGHENGHRLFIPLAQAIDPRLLGKAVDELTIAFAKAGFNLLNYGVDLTASKTVSRLMGLPLQKTGTIVPWDLSERFKYKVKAEHHDSGFVPIGSDDMQEFNAPTVENLTSFISGYVDKHNITFNKGERDNNLTRLIGGVAKAFAGVADDDLIEALYNSNIAQLLDNPGKDITNKTRRLLKG